METPKMNEQTIFVTPSGSSTLEFQTIQRVPVYEPAQRGWIDYNIYESTIETIDYNGVVERWNVETGKTERWYCRPGIAEVVTMKAGGYYYEFAKDGSIRGSCKDGTGYWGPIREEEYAELLSAGTADVNLYTSRDQLWDHLAEIHRRATDPMLILEEETDSWWSRHLDKRWRRNTSIREEMKMDMNWLARVKKRLETNPKVYNNEEVRLAHEERIRELEVDIAYNQSILNPPDACPECKREGVCVCYT
jgi:hypothetical protein